MAAAAAPAGAPLIVHIIYRLDIGGLENGLVNLINRMPVDRYRHAIVCLTEHGEFARRIQRRDVELHALHKRPGKDLPVYGRLWRLLRKLRPQIVHTRNLAALDTQIVVALAGVRRRVHGEHGWDVYDLHGTSPKYNRLRRFCRRFIHRYVAMSRHLAEWLETTVGVEPGRIRQIYSGVDSQRFQPRSGARNSVLPAGFAPAGCVVFGTVGRMEPVKDQITLAQAFVRLVATLPPGTEQPRLVMIGDGPLRAPVSDTLRAAGLLDLAWLPGSRNDVPELMRALDVFVLPSLNEGISNTLLEAMACALPVVATRVGGNTELVEEGLNGSLCAAADPDDLARALRPYLYDPGLRQAQGRAGRALVERQFNLDSMVAAYTRIYDELMAEHP